MNREEFVSAVGAHTGLEARDVDTALRHYGGCHTSQGAGGGSGTASRSGREALPGNLARVREPH